MRYDSKEPEAVKIALGNLEGDLKKVLPGVEVIRRERPFGEETEDTESAVDAVISIRTVTGTDTDTDADNGRIDCSRMYDERGILRREAFCLSVQEGRLYITGADRRGTVYGIYSFCEWMGVSPWYYFGDVPVRKKQELMLEEGYCRTDWPSVEYRGIFINDEEELEAWVQNCLGEATIGVKSYEKIFELLLRLKANYIWPAMHVNSFNLTPENGALADRMGIVVGTSHCDMLMRSNNREWKPWIEKKGYKDAVYDYSVPGRNREILKEYWRESVEQNKDYEVCYTLGMRGIHDSGFETRGLAGKSKEEILDDKVALLEKIIGDQREILRSVHREKSMTTFIPYKEVLELYDNGLHIPEDVTLVWANDNYGYIRRYPSEEEKKRKGGNGIYYHNSYWAPPSMSYVFLGSIPLAHTRNELQKAWNEGIRKLWVLNCGAMKPLEQEITFFLSLAWEIGKAGALTENVDAWAEAWINSTFGTGGNTVSRLLNDFSQLTNVRKVENMDYDAFSQTAYGDEAAMRIHQYEKLFAEGNAVYEKLPEEEKAAFFQLVLMRIHAGYFTNLAFYYGDRSTLMYDRGNMQAAQYYTEKSREAEDAGRRMLYFYNHVMSGGKWRGILNPEGFPPPRAAMMPVCTPPLGITGKPDMRVDVWNGEEELVFAQPGEKWIEIGNMGTGALEVRLQGPEWAELSESNVVIQREKRILIRVRDGGQDREGRILAENLQDGCVREILVKTVRTEGVGEGCAAEEDGIVVMEADTALSMEQGKGVSENETARQDAWSLEAVRQPDTEYMGRQADRIHGHRKGKGSSDDFRIVPRLGRMKGNLAESCVQREPEEYRMKGNPEETCVQREPEENQEAKAEGYVNHGNRSRGTPLCYEFIVRSKGEFLLEIHRFPSLNSIGRIRVGISLDQGPVRIAESLSNDEWRGSWRKNVLNNVDRLYLPLTVAEPGKHRLFVWAVDKYFAFSRMVLYTKARKENNLAGLKGEQPLPAQWDIPSWCDDFYGRHELLPRPVFYASGGNLRDTLAVTCQAKQAERYGKKVEPAWYLERGKRGFAEKQGNVRIDAAAALAQSRWAWTQEPVPAGGQGQKCGLWRHCAGESFGRSGLAMYIRTPELHWKAPEAPGLNYRFSCEGGEYTLWMLSKFNVKDEGFFAAGIDGNLLPEERLYGKGGLWRYEAEQVYRWVPAVQGLKLEPGEHVLQVYALSSGMRFDRFYLTRGTEQPPEDTEWMDV